MAKINCSNKYFVTVYTWLYLLSQDTEWTKLVHLFLLGYWQFFLTLILSELKVVSLCHQYRARQACTSVQSDQTLYYKNGWPSSSSHLDIPKNDNGQFPKWKWYIPFKKFSRLRVKPFIISLAIWGNCNIFTPFIH